MKRLLVILLLISVASFAQNEELFDTGKEQYKNAKYQEAINSWQKIVENGEHSAELYFNIANAEYKLNKIGPSIYYYEKALQLDPNDRDIKTNLTFAENARVDAVTPLPRTIFSKWYKNIAGIFTYNGWATLSIVFSILFVGLFLLYYFSYTARIKRLLFTLSMLSVVLFVGSISMAFLTYGDYSRNNPAIIFAEEIEVKAEPSRGSSTAFVLHEGTKVQVTAEDGQWYRILLSDGKDGWIQSSELKKL